MRLYQGILSNQKIEVTRKLKSDRKPALRRAEHGLYAVACASLYDSLYLAESSGNLALGTSGNFALGGREGYISKRVAYSVAFALAITIAVTSGAILSSFYQRLSFERSSAKLLQSMKVSLSKETQSDEQQLAQSLLPEPEPAKSENVVLYKLKEGDGVDSILSKIGANGQEKLKAASALSFLGGTKLGAKLEVLKEKTGEILSLKFHRSDSSTVSLNKNELGGFHTVVNQANGDVKSQRVYSAMIKGSFSEAVRRAGVPAYIVDDFVDLFDDKVNFQKDLERGDSFAVLLEELDVGSKNTQPKILAATITAEGKPFYAIRYVGADAKVRYVDEKGEFGEKNLLKYPLQFTRISSVFSNSRFHPVLRRGRAHNGVDFAAPYGTVVRTVGEGMVLEARYHSENGNFVRIKHNDRYTTEYLHLSKIGAGIRQGARVAQGQVIGAVGSTGLSTGSHLHFGLFDSGHYVDPMNSKALTVIANNKVDRAPKRFIDNAIAMLNLAQKSAVSIASAAQVQKTDSDA